MLDAYGIPVASDRVVHDADEAAAAAALGFPVVLKVESVDIAHKTEAGVVRLGLADAAAVRAAYAEVMAAAQALASKPRIAGVLVQPMIPAGVELVVGAQNDPTFGPMVVVGLGGIMVELLKDSTAELAPVNHPQAQAMLRRLRGFALLEGFRNQPGVDLDQVADIIVRASELAHDLRDQISEIDINPIICSPGRAIAVDALIIRNTAPDHSAPTLEPGD
jgi:acyl-CoA synthetase (NDP forming)